MKFKLPKIIKIILCKLKCKCVCSNCMVKKEEDDNHIEIYHNDDEIFKISIV